MKTKFSRFVAAGRCMGIGRSTAQVIGAEKCPVAPANSSYRWQEIFLTKYFRRKFSYEIRDIAILYAAI